MDSGLVRFIWKIHPQEADSSWRRGVGTAGRQGKVILASYPVFQNEAGLDMHAGHVYKSYEHGAHKGVTSSHTTEAWNTRMGGCWEPTLTPFTGLLNQHHCEDQLLRAPSFLLCRSALSARCSERDCVSESPEELAKPRSRVPTPMPPSFWFSNSGLRSKKWSFGASSLVMPRCWSANRTYTENNCSRPTGVTSPRDYTLWSQGLTDSGCKRPAPLPQIRVALRRRPFSKAPQNRLWRLMPTFPQSSCPPHSCFPQSLKGCSLVNHGHGTDYWVFVLRKPNLTQIFTQTIFLLLKLHLRIVLPF